MRKKMKKTQKLGITTLPAILGILRTVSADTGISISMLITYSLAYLIHRGILGKKLIDAVDSYGDINQFE